VVIFGIGTDYCLLLVSRYAEELHDADEEGDELRARTLAGTLAVLATVLASSAATVAVGFSGFGLARFGLYRSLWPAMAIAVVITGLAALTLAPSLMRALGRNLFWPRHLTSAHMPTTVELEEAA
ncbi:MAG: MMPL family transporter, partial [Geminicoccaceae bacterium]